jgi:hypothetical protein
MAREDTYQHLKISTMWRLITSSYVDESNVDRVNARAMRGCRSLDPTAPI